MLIRGIARGGWGWSDNRHEGDVQAALEREALAGFVRSEGLNRFGHGDQHIEQILKTVHPSDDGSQCIGCRPRVFRWGIWFPNTRGFREEIGLGLGKLRGEFVVGSAQGIIGSEIGKFHGLLWTCLVLGV